MAGRSFALARQAGNTHFVLTSPEPHVVVFKPPTGLSPLVLGLDEWGPVKGSSEIDSEPLPQRHAQHLSPIELQQKGRP
jgi:hypothetical protein